MTAPANRAPSTPGERLLLRTLAAAATFGLILVVFALTEQWLDADLQFVWLLVLLLGTHESMRFFAFRRPR